MNMASRMAANKLQSMFTSTKSQKSSSGVTDQYDKKTIYRKRRMPRKMRKRWSRKKRNFDSMLIKKLATKTIVLNGTIGAAWAGPSQRNNVIHIYGKNGTERAGSELGTDDVYRICTNDPQSDDQIEKVIFDSALIDFTVANTGATNLEFDVYEMYSGKLRNHITPNWGSDQGTAQIQTPVIGGGGVSLNLDARGVTPFEFPLMSRYGWRITKKTKFLLSPGKAFTYQYRDNRNRWVKGTDIFRNAAGTDMCLYGGTRTFLFLAKNVVGTDNESQNAYTVGTTRVYRYKVLQDNQIESENLS